MSRAPVLVGTRVKRDNGRWQVKVAPGEWKWEPRRSRKRKGRVVAFEVSHEEWALLVAVVEAWGEQSVAAFARCLVLDTVVEDLLPDLALMRQTNAQRPERTR